MVGNTNLQTRLAWLQRAEALCKQQGARLTPTRKRVLELIIDAPCGAKAYDILDKLTQENASARPPTIYRALDFLLAQGLIHRIESLNAYVACCDPEHAHGYQLLICECCGQVTELPAAAVEAKLYQIAASIDFTLKRHTIELQGICATCAQETSAD
ncbi:Fur family transcriptional regulator, zinc uptake regulator [Allopseudospirillum japonicum]|uniref:Ferric uptake regulation protein n=1 Tax=Allopseudospirillum japonicum TaxID=64971 RepID=A0A1H6SDN8_9GAMM|nr:transcriptional repressor [Allopseudospirillum japonicum]SEI64926.1 Fur family transcriptional regulator, zinc uptake regulator [Allopseudospirillum japonicum]